VQLRSTSLTNPSPLIALTDSQASLSPLGSSSLSKLTAASSVTFLFLLPPLGNHDVIFGRKFLSWVNVKLAVRDRVIEWPADLPPVYLPPIRSFALTRQSLLPPKINPTAQADAVRRDATFAKEIRKEQQRMAVVKSILPRPLNSLPKPGIVKEKLVIQPKIKPVDIAGISGLAFSLNMRRQGNTIFSTSLYEIDRLLEDRKAEARELSQQDVLANAASALLGSIDKYAEDNERVRLDVPD
jgi:hypothetical protein